MNRTIVLTLALSACLAWRGVRRPLVDNDGDGFTADADCDDLDGDINPAATEVCDGIDNDCDDLIDDDDDSVDPASQRAFYTDADGDTYGDDDSLRLRCAAEKGVVDVGGDCDDSASDINPVAIELCDLVDNDCDDATDEDYAASILSQLVAVTWMEAFRKRAVGLEASVPAGAWESSTACGPRRATAERQHIPVDAPEVEQATKLLARLDPPPRKRRRPIETQLWALSEVALTVQVRPEDQWAARRVRLRLPRTVLHSVRVGRRANA